MAQKKGAPRREHSVLVDCQVCHADVAIEDDPRDRTQLVLVEHEDSRGGRCRGSGALVSA